MMAALTKTTIQVRRMVHQTTDQKTIDLEVIEVEVVARTEAKPILAKMPPPLIKYSLRWTTRRMTIINRMTMKIGQDNVKLDVVGADLVH